MVLLPSATDSERASGPSRDLPRSIITWAQGSRHTCDPPSSFTCENWDPRRSGGHGQNRRWPRPPEPLKCSETHPDIGQFRAQHKHVPVALSRAQNQQWMDDGCSFVERLPSTGANKSYRPATTRLGHPDSNYN